MAENTSQGLSIFFKDKNCLSLKDPRVLTDLEGKPMPTTDEEFHESMWPKRDNSEIARLMVSLMDETFTAKRRGIVVPKAFSFTSYIEAEAEHINTSEVAASLLQELKVHASNSNSYSHLNITTEDTAQEKLLSISFTVKASSWKEASVLSSELFTVATTQAGISFDEDADDALAPFCKMGTKLTLGHF